MADPVAKPWSVAGFFAWQEKQSARYELVGGFPLRMMAGARNVHDLIVVNVLADLRGQLRGGGYRPFTGDGSVETSPGQIRRPDIGVDCGKWNPDAMVADTPRLVAEVLSPTTRDFDTFGKLDEYKRIGSLQWILLIEPNAPEVTAWSRDGSKQWVKKVFENLAEEISMPELGIELSLNAIYEGVSFPLTPRLVPDGHRTSDENEAG
jgi:Uma2 family endonuclease